MDYGEDVCRKFCGWCGKEFLVARRNYDKDSGVKLPRTKFCNRSCSNRNRYKINDKLKNFGETDAAYLAGIIDGEGSIIRLKRKNGSISYRVVVVNTDWPMLEWITDTTGVGSLNTKPRQEEGHKPCWYWVVNAQTARQILERCYPYMIIKKDKAKKAIDHLQGIVNTGREMKYG